MELIVINEEKLKIILSPDDMKKLNISATDLDYQKSSTKRVIWEILDTAKQTEGFDTDNSRLYIQVFPACDGGCEMFVTKTAAKKRTSIQGAISRAYKTKTQTNENLGIYSLLDFKELCILCKLLTEHTAHIKTNLYRDSDGTYILFMFPASTSDSTFSKSEISVLLPPFTSEYGQIHETTPKAIAYVKEHCQKIAEGNAAILIAGL
jgi:negative regulator of genetic competence, sporulation and motility